MGKRLVFIDISRALCVIWIVAFWHMNQYMSADIKFFPSESFSRQIGLGYTNGVLALFTLISGYFMSQKKITSKKEVIAFFKKRLIRFAIPLFLSCFILGCLGFLDWFQAITVCLGISGVLPAPYPPTLWFFSMIILFYILTPFMLWIRTIATRYVCMYVTTIYLFFFLGCNYLWFDSRLTENWPFYAVPFLFPRDVDIMSVFKKKINFLLTFILLSIILFFIYENKSINASFDINACICFIVLSISNLLSKISIISKVFTSISFASMFAYLFHREVYILMQKVLGSFTYIEVFFVVFVLFCISYYMQKIYNKYSILIDK